MSFLLTHYDEELFEGSKVVVATERKFAGLRLASAKEVLNTGMFLMLYGPGGAGKTRCAGVLARSVHGAKALHVDVEGGATALADLVEEGCLDTAPVTKWAEITNVRKAFESDPGPYKTVILDNWTEMQMVALKSVVTGQPEIQHWGQTQAKVLEEMRSWRDISRSKGVNVIFIAWDITEKDEATGFIRKMVQFTPSLAAKIPGIVTMVGHLTVEDSGYRELSFAPSKKTDSKFRVAPNEEAANIPQRLWYRGADTSPLHDILETIREGTKFPVSAYAKPKPGQ